MKKLITILAIILSTTVFSQTTANKIESIIKSVEKINKDTIGSKSKVTVDSDSTLNKIKGIYKDGHLKKLIFKRENMIMGYIITEYYFLDNKLIFVHEKEDN